METVLVCLSPGAQLADYGLFETQLKGPAWEAQAVDVTTLRAGGATEAAAAVAYAADWSDALVATWLPLVRSAIGPHRRLLAILPRPPDSYPPEIQATWTRAVGYGYKIADLIAIVDGFLAGRA